MLKQNADLLIVYEDRDVLVADKPPGLLTSTVPREKRPTLLAMVREYLDRTSPDARLGLIHRLDRDAAGLLVFSKCAPAYYSLKSQFFAHTVTRTYTALVEGVPPQKKATIRSRLEERADGTVYSTTRHAAGQPAATDYEIISHANGRALLKVTLQTGRKHQVRVHLAGQGTPIVGDVMYGKADRAGLHLKATFLAFDHPRTGKRMEFTREANFNQTPVRDPESRGNRPESKAARKFRKDSGGGGTARRAQGGAGREGKKNQP